ncbi:MAG: phosphopyruvate hydratase [Planctomycetes bacterium]|nr:phosphopyruvate hydratase [Planctomycetota bacterium]
MSAAPHSASRITQVHAREVFDSRGRPTVEVEITCTSGHTGRAIAPSGASKGRFEALELRDQTASRLGGAGVRQAVANVDTIMAPALIGLDAAEQDQVDRRLLELDGTANCSRLGANALVAVSLATAHAAAAAQGRLLVEHLYEVWQKAAHGLPTQGRTRTAALGRSLVMPLPMVNMISGGLHAGKNLDFQDFLIIPVGANSYSQALDWIVTIYHRLGKLLGERGLEGVLVGDEGGYGPRLAANEQAVATVVEAISACGLTPGRDVALALDVAATHFTEIQDGQFGYRLSAGGNRWLTSAEFIAEIESWTRKYPIISIEDPLDEADTAGWQAITPRLHNKVQLIGDDLFVTNPQRFEALSGQGIANSVLIKVNQIGTLSQTFATMRLALAADYWPVVSARSGETEDATIADLAVATGAGQIKIGSVARSERLAKYNQLLRLEERLQDRAAWLGGTIFTGLH